MNETHKGLCIKIASLFLDCDSVSVCIDEEALDSAKKALVKIGNIHNAQEKKIVAQKAYIEELEANQ